jgi:hypothetical protein
MKGFNPHCESLAVLLLNTRNGYTDTDCDHRPAGHFAGAFVRGVQCRHGNEGGVHCVDSQSSERRPVIERCGHQGDAGFDPVGTTSQN